MLKHTLQRLLLVLPVLLGVLLIGFLLMQVVPTDPAQVRAGPTATQDVVQAIRQELGLDQPLWKQFAIYIGRLAQGDLGVSIINNVPVTQELGSTIGPTLELMLASLVWAIPLGMFLGTVGAYYRGSLIDRAIMAFSVAGVSLPVFFLGLGLIWLFGFYYPILPFTGRTGPLWTWEGIQGIILPAITLGGVFVGPVARMTRTSVLDELGADHVRTARAKGLGEATVVLRHTLRNALVPVVTLIGLQIGFLLGGAVVTETVFSWPGIGRLAVGAILSSDLPMAQGTIIMLSLGFILVNLAVDVLYAVLDPRVRGT
ncbi:MULTISPECIES: ABC transporter permease [Bosea]|jgi:ABC-type dipeptide/oligopeptide/nickel transport system permease component|uniref:ABC transporter permease n=1 Tax=Bosea TaxID=85413 RepID=UPI0021500786|nr:MULTISPECIES: ABC transporter permease [Bosea]MCR4522076.1 ABC transporter permease [Bosea sp. 47.2.35]MDR6829446.1 ABC-type dipeptide/oligopeptide/nickel transport system permease component [Bosea robiniae]MDR6896329.1 ABC-type dipeptide/oligopeptide/nickel transport system permease component [Bosea sp. BE109]MDR7139727.1 ABC-type dipeptide/oligopeptide/nickel transport system permease component [Bosea sp. BE168]MDR7176551.1 ABC-type dipeptide/oligopeptide/nickel transport system permease 